MAEITRYFGDDEAGLRLGAVVFVFFFQAEDGIRDLTVTGVQTCALPICAWVQARSSSGVNAGMTGNRSWPTRSLPRRNKAISGFGASRRRSSLGFVRLT